MIRILTILSLFCLLAVKANAQSSTVVTQQVDLSLTNVIVIKYTSSGTSTGASINLPISTLANYTNGVTSTAQQLTVSSTKGFNIAVKAAATNFTYSGTYTTGTTMPVSKLKVQVTANSTGGAIAGTYSSYTSLTNTNANIITSGTAGTNKTFSIQYQALPGMGYPAGTYATTVTFTATQL